MSKNENKKANALTDEDLGKVAGGYGCFPQKMESAWGIYVAKTPENQRLSREEWAKTYRGDKKAECKDKR